MKDRYRRISTGLTLSPTYEDRTADAKFALLSLIISPRQTPPGVYDGGLKALRNETGLPGKRLEAALKELEAAGTIVTVSTGGWWVVETFRAQCCNEEYAKAALNLTQKKYHEIFPRFLKENSQFLEKYPSISKIILPSDPRLTGVSPPTHTAQSPTGSEAVAVTGTEAVTGSGAGAAPKPPRATSTYSGSGGRGTGEVGGADTRNAPLEGASATASPQDTGKGNGKSIGERGAPSGLTDFAEGLSLMKRATLDHALDLSLRGEKEAAIGHIKAAGFNGSELDRAKELLGIGSEQ